MNPATITEMESMTGRMARIGRILRTCHRLHFTPLLLALVFGLLRAVVWLGMTLDFLFFPKLRRTRAKRPIVIVGNPRTGTTYLQRFLVAEGIGTGMT